MIFDDSFEPSEKMVGWLLKCVEKGGSTFNVFTMDTYIDQSHSVSFFLLRLLLQCRHNETVKAHLHKILESNTSSDLHQLIVASFQVCMKLTSVM